MRNYPICKCCRKKLKGYGRSLCWSCYRGKNHQNYRKPWGKLKTLRSFYQYNKQGDLLTTWKCLSEMENCTRMKTSNVRKALNGELKSAYKFIWRYV